MQSSGALVLSFRFLLCTSIYLSYFKKSCSYALTQCARDTWFIYSSIVALDIVSVLLLYWCYVLVTALQPFCSFMIYFLGVAISFILLRVPEVILWRNDDVITWTIVDHEFQLNSTNENEPYKQIQTCDLMLLLQKPGKLVRCLVEISHVHLTLYTNLYTTAIQWQYLYWGHIHIPLCLKTLLLEYAEIVLPPNLVVKAQ